MATDTLGDSARQGDRHYVSFICRGGPNDSIFPSGGSQFAGGVWGYNTQLLLPPIPGVYPTTPRIFSIATGILVGTIPKGAWIESVGVYVLTGFNAGTTNTLLCGTVAANTASGSFPGTFNSLVAAGDVNASVAGISKALRGEGPSLAISGDLDVYVQYTSTGAAASAGSAIIKITFTTDMG